MEEVERGYFADFLLVDDQETAVNDGHDSASHDAPRGLSGLQKGTIVISFLSVLGGAVANWTDVFKGTTTASAGLAAPQEQVAGMNGGEGPATPLVEASPTADGASLSEGVGVHILAPADSVESPCVDKFEGPLLAGKPTGNGVLISCDGMKISGSFLDGLAHGNASATYSDGRKYIGEWVAGVYNGTGTLELSNGAKYRGNFENGHASGQGEYSYLDGSVYLGNFKDDKLDG